MDFVRFGRGIRALRRRRHWRQVDLAAAVGCSQTLVARIERGDGATVRAGTLHGLAQALGARAVLRLDWNGEALDRLMDADHAAIVERVVRILVAAGWQVVTEATFAVAGERGSVDVLAWHAASDTLLVVEVKSVIADAQDTLAKLDRKVRLATRIAPREWQVAGGGSLGGRALGFGAVGFGGLGAGGSPGSAIGERRPGASALLVVADTRTNRRRIEALSGTFATAFPDRIATVRRFIRDPGSGRLRGLWFLPIGPVATTRHRVRRF